MLHPKRIWAIAKKEFLQLSRDRLTFALIVIVPLVELSLFGYAINTNVKHIPVAVVDQSHTTLSRRLIHDMEAGQTVVFQQSYNTPQSAMHALIAGKMRAVLILPKDLQARIDAQSPYAQWLVDGSDTMISSAIFKLANMPVPSQDHISPPQQESHFTISLLFNPARISAINIVPGLIAVILTMTMIMFTAAAIVRERERGNLEMLINTPVKPMELMLGKIVPYIFAGLVQMFIVLFLGHQVFAVPINGSVVDILLATLLFISASLTLGLLISTVTTTQLQAMQMTIFILLPSILLSGFLFPYEGMPKPAQHIAEFFPATHFIRLIRGLVLRGAHIGALKNDALWLFIFTLGGLCIAALRFKKTLD